MSKLISDIEIEKYKCFENFQANNLKRVNLISGKNNVGKTAFLEAIYLVASSSQITHFLFALVMIEKNRDKLNLSLSEQTSVIEILQNNKIIKMNSLNNIKYKIVENNINFTVEININGISKKVDFNTQIVFEKSKNTLFIDNFGFTNSELKETYKAVQFKDKDNEINKFLKNFNFINPKFKIIDDKPYIKTDDSGEYHYISKYGDGLKHYISILCSLYACENGYLFIDEIENGIHYALYDKLWEIIFQIAQEQNVQIFITTHSKECIESYNRVSKNSNAMDISFIEFGKNKQNSIKANVITSEQLDKNLTLDNGIRGW